MLLYEEFFLSVPKWFNRKNLELRNIVLKIFLKNDSFVSHYISFGLCRNVFEL